MEWDRDAVDSTKQIPFFLRKAIRDKIESAVAESGRFRVTLEDVREIRQKAGARPGNGKSSYGGPEGTNPDVSKVEPVTEKFIGENATADSSQAATSHPAPSSDKHENVKLTQGSFDDLERAVRREHTYDTRYYNIKGCGGAAGCPLTLVNPTRVASLIIEEIEEQRLEEFLAESIKGPVLAHHKFKASVAGCANCCSEPQIKDLGIIAQIMPDVSEEQCIECMQCVDICKDKAVTVTDASPAFDRALCLNCGDCTKVCPTGAIRVAKEGYAILVGGKLGRHPQLAVRLVELASEDTIRAAIRSSIRLMKQEACNGERLGAVIQRVGIGQFNKLLEEEVSTNSHH